MDEFDTWKYACMYLSFDCSSHFDFMYVLQVYAQMAYVFFKYEWTHTRVYTYTHIHTYINTCIHTYMHTCMHTYIHTYIHRIPNQYPTLPYMYPQKCTCTYIHIYIHTYIHTYTEILV